MPEDKMKVELCHLPLQDILDQRIIRIVITHNQGQIIMGIIMETIMGMEEDTRPGILMGIPVLLVILITVATLLQTDIRDMGGRVLHIQELWDHRVTRATLETQVKPIFCLLY